jgi:hypothetical protein
MDRKKASELSPLLRSKQHQHYLKFGSGPVLHKSGSMRAAPFLKQTDEKTKKQISKHLKRYMMKHRRFEPALTSTLVRPPGTRQASMDDSQLYTRSAPSRALYRRGSIEEEEEGQYFP